jgi:hypothetical protein
VSDCAIGWREADRDWSETILRALLDDLPHVQLRVTGDCMRPALLPGDTVRLVSTGRRRPRLGDLVLVRLPAGLRLHRLVWGWPAGVRARRTKADRSLYWDPAFEPADVWGAVVAVERGGRALPRPRRIGPALRSVGGALLRRSLRGRQAAAPSTGAEPGEPR